MPCLQNLKKRLFGLVLAGGRSSRMGQDKALLRPWGEGGPTMLEHAAALLRPLTRDLRVACAPGRPYAGQACLEDPCEGMGPAIGVLGGLRMAASRDCCAMLTLPCDLPGMSRMPLKYLVAEHFRPPEKMASLFFSPASGRVEMLAGIYSVAFLPWLAQGLEQGQKSLYQILSAHDFKILPTPREWLPCFRNCNTPEDMTRFQRLAADGCEKASLLQPVARIERA